MEQNVTLSETPERVAPISTKSNYVWIGFSAVIFFCLGFLVGYIVRGTVSNSSANNSSMQAYPTVVNQISPTNNPVPDTTNWKNYTFNALTLKLPPTWWQIQGDDVDGNGKKTAGLYMNINPTALRIPGDQPPAFQLMFETKTLEQQKSKLSEQLTEVKESNITVAGIQSVLLEGTTKPGLLGPRKIKTVLIPNGKGVYYFQEVSKNSAAKGYFDSILSTFSFKTD